MPYSEKGSALTKFKTEDLVKRANTLAKQIDDIYDKQDSGEIKEGTPENEAAEKKLSQLTDKFKFFEKELKVRGLETNEDGYFDKKETKFKSFTRQTPPNAGTHGAKRVTLDDDEKYAFQDEPDLKKLVTAGKVSIAGNELWYNSGDEDTIDTLSRFISNMPEESDAIEEKESEPLKVVVPKNLFRTRIGPHIIELKVADTSTGKKYLVFAYNEKSGKSTAGSFEGKEVTKLEKILGQENNREALAKFAKSALNFMTKNKFFDKKED